MQYFIICLVAFIGSGLTLFSGFGLGTLLVPVFALFFPIELSIALTAIVHFLNNIFKLSLLGKHADKKTLLRFGLPSLIAAFAGAFVLSSISNAQALFQYTVGTETLQVLPLKLTIGLLLIFFALFDIVPKLSSIQFDKKYLVLGGLLSGFFGGLSGNQGALRSAFLIRANLSKEAFIATGVVIACLVDVSRLSVYYGRVFNSANEINYKLVIAATLCAFSGAYFGNKFVKKITIKLLQTIVAIALIIFGFLLSAGIL
ncbi:sulfite exporter TauE/SafE family protein [Aurantibacillus circumpalustris]|uniref:sulfite exporter TauE/SafE family protein n=1 Tax=Aurantibacillus circumpalustris TaxID=3036359 RepID=UPI00295BFE80|nr:sulfite exporter TauE/SafE family protein [Aurantibacillus circumpalustris]